MIISHRHRYVFVELPRTGSRAVRRELRELYDGVPILHKHSTYDEFRRQASDDERGYFAFSAIRNPLDDAVSRYFKLKTDHHQRFSDVSRQRHRRPLNSLLDTRMYRYIATTDADFSTFFLHFYRMPFDTWASLDHQSFGSVMRFERLADDFDATLRRIGIEPVRPLPEIASYEGAAAPYPVGRAAQHLGELPLPLRSQRGRYCPSSPADTRHVNGRFAESRRWRWHRRRRRYDRGCSS